MLFVKKFVERFLLEIIDEIYDRGYTMTEDQVNKLYDDLILLVRQ